MRVIVRQASGQGQRNGHFIWRRRPSRPWFRSVPRRRTRHGSFMGRRGLYGRRTGKLRDMDTAASSLRTMAAAGWKIASSTVKHHGAELMIGRGTAHLVAGSTVSAEQLISKHEVLSGQRFRDASIPESEWTMTGWRCGKRDAVSSSRGCVGAAASACGIGWRASCT